MSRLVKHNLYLDQLYGCAVVLLYSLFTPVPHLVITSAHTLFGPVVIQVHMYGILVQFTEVPHNLLQFDGPSEVDVLP